MKKESYLLNCTILEARGLVLEDANSISPFVRIRVNEETQITTTQYKMNTVTWNQQFTFPEIKMNKYELEMFEMILEVYSFAGFQGNTLIGEYSIGLSTLFRSPNHELYKQWVRLQKKDNPTVCVGHLQLSCFLIGQNELPPVHENKGNELQDSDDEDNSGNQLAMLERQREHQGLRVISAPKFDNRTFQLIVKIFKADGLPNWTDGNLVNSFVTVRTQGCHLQTNPINRANQAWNVKLCFPVYWPTHNDKITIRLWHDNSLSIGYLNYYLGLTDSESFLALVPELPSGVDIFNISELLPRQGKMDPRWVNMYGVLPQDRDKVADFRQMPTSGWMGRILLSLAIVENARPLFKIESMQGASDPKSEWVQILVDVYELFNCNELYDDAVATGRKLRVEIYARNFNQKSKAAKRIEVADSSEKVKSFSWVSTNDRSQIEPLEVDFNINVKQRADIFVYLLLGDERVGFIRIPSDSEAIKDTKPTWLYVNSMVNSKRIIGLLLINIQIVKVKERGSSNIIQRFKKPKKEENYTFNWQIISGYEIAPNTLEEDVETAVRVQIGTHLCRNKQILPDKTESQEQFKKGRYPLYNFLDGKENIKLSSELRFAPNMAVTLIKKEKAGMIQNESEVQLGQFLVPILSILKKYSSPQYFSFIDQEGIIVGKVLCRFYLQPRDLALMSKKKNLDLNQQKLLQAEYFNDLRLNCKPMNVSVSLLCIRGLDQELARPRIEVSLTDSFLSEEKKVQQLADLENAMRDDDEKEDEDEEDKEEEIEIFKDFFADGKQPKEHIKRENNDLVVSIDPGEGAHHSKNPNLGAVVHFKKVMLNKQLLCWPLLYIKVYDGNEYKYHVTQPLFLCIDDRKLDIDWTQKDIKLATAQMMTSNKIECTQKQENPVRCYLKHLQHQLNSKIKAEIDLRIEEVLHLIDINSWDDEDSDDLERKIIQDQDKNKVDQNDSDQSASEEEKLKNDDPDEHSDNSVGEMSLEEIKLLLKNDNEADIKNGGQDKQKQLGDDQEEDDDDPLKPKEADFIVHIEYNKSIEDQKAENELREKEIEDYKSLLKKLSNIKNGLDAIKSNLFKSEVQNAMMKVRLKIETLNREVDEQKYLKQIFEEQDNFKREEIVGRDVLRNVLMETKIAEFLPIKKIQLQTHSLQTQISNKEESKLYRAGEQKLAFLRFDLRIKETPKKDGRLEVTKNDEVNDIENEQEWSDEKKLNAIIERRKVGFQNPIDCFNSKFLKKLIYHEEKYKVFVQVIRCQNCTAVDNNIQRWQDSLAGEQAKCSADPFPVLIIGDNPPQIDPSIAIQNDLNPRFYKMFEFDVEFPEEWNLTVQIRDKPTGYLERLNLFNSINLIGETVIDLEERLLGSKLFLCRLIHWVRVEEYKEGKNNKKQVAAALKSTQRDRQTKESLQNQDDTEDKALKREREWIAMEDNWLQNIKLQKQPLEIRTLKRKGVDQAQGTIELITEVVAEDELAQRDNQLNVVINRENRQNYEIRLIIYKVKEVFNQDGTPVGSLYLSAVLQASNWIHQPIRKETDKHHNSKDGRGMFNYRMKFPLEMPADFPRIKIQLYGGAYIEDQALGETTINLKKTIALKRKQGDLEDKKFWISFLGKDNRKAGHALIQLQVLTESDATLHPVGEAQNEPNQNPFLAYPTEGRGIGARMGSVFGGISLPSIGMPNMFRLAIIFGVIIVVVIIAGFLLMFFKK